jgi:hypothetical protein
VAGPRFAAHWGVTDAAAFCESEDEKRRFFARSAATWKNRLEILASLRIERARQFGSFALNRRVLESGRITPR